METVIPTLQGGLKDPPCAKEGSRPGARGVMVHLLTSEVQQLLHNKFVVILGDSVHRAVYKDLVLLLQKDCLLTPSQLKAKGEESFEQDKLLEGGQLGPMHNGVEYREVRQFCSGHHRVRFYFLTRVYSQYLEGILDELRSGEHFPDVIIMNSCLWDISRYGPNSWPSYLENLGSLFARLGQVLPESCLMVWNTAMPVGGKVTGGFLPPDPQPSTASLETSVVEANFHSSVEAKKHGFDVLDLHFHFRHACQHRQRDGVHWDERGHRHLSQLLLAHLADAWGVELPQRQPVGRWIKDGPAGGNPGQGVARQPQARRDPQALPLPRPLPPPGYGPLLPLPPPRLPLPPHLPPQALPSPFHQGMPQFLLPQDACFPSDHPFQSDQSSLSYFHLDVPCEADFMFGPQPPVPPTPHYRRQLPVVQRGFHQNSPRGRYMPWRRPRPFRRRGPAHPKPRFQ
ncbi:PC-esterase domain-containing protein 1B isoform X1 [Diceros bicornis minor]|uniref:PC-esterase domain-containing protein 1B isoform X1 n=2 Tax=Diceros bicornis minor TaxID=77932 RepID=UPI0026E9633F|nr:PC-esterase domain-containing protein 1B isoform X1 [Diceros bicornis minor]